MPGAPTIAGVTIPSPRGRVFRRTPLAEPPVAVEAHGATIRDSTGREYLDAAGGAVVVNVGHGRRSIAEAMADQAGRLAYVHGSAFTTDVLETYAAELGERLPLAGPAIYPVSGGSEAMETALKLARAYHLARGDAEAEIVASAARAASAAAARDALVVAVSNEVGLGIVPVTPLGRTYRDLLGTVNRTFVEASAEAAFVVAGRPVPLADDAGFVTRIVGAIGG